MSEIPKYSMNIAREAKKNLTNLRTETKCQKLAPINSNPLLPSL